MKPMQALRNPQRPFLMGVIFLLLILSVPGFGEEQPSLASPESPVETREEESETETVESEPVEAVPVVEEGTPDSVEDSSNQTEEAGTEESEGEVGETAVEPVEEPLEEWVEEEPDLEELEAEVRSQLIGTWMLRSFEQRGSDGKFLQPLGARPQGMLIYTEDGRFSLQVGRSQRRGLVSNERSGWGYTRASDAEARSAFEGYWASYGQYSVEVLDEVVRHHVEGGLNPDDTGLLEDFSFAVSQGSLILTPVAFEADGDVRMNTLVWERVPESTPQGN